MGKTRKHLYRLAASTVPEVPWPAGIPDCEDICGVLHEDMEAVIKACERQQL